MSRPETEAELWCGACQSMHRKSEFGKSKHDPTGFANTCKTKRAERNRLYYAIHKGDIKARIVASRKKIDRPLKHLLLDASAHADEQGLEFNLTIETIPRPTRCPVLGVELVYQAGWMRKLANQASLDRIDNRRGYTIDNVWVICRRAKQIKSGATLEEMKRLCAALDLRLLAENGELPGGAA